MDFPAIDHDQAEPPASSATPVSATRQTVVEDRPDSTENTKSSPTRKRKRSDARQSRWTDQVLILAGPDEIGLNVPKHLIRNIPFFRACLDAPMKESEEGIIRLPEDSYRSVDVLVHWVYRKKFEDDLMKETYRWFLDRNAPKPKILTMVEAYVVAKKWMAEEMQNAVLDSVVSAYLYVRPSSTTLKYVVGATEEGDYLREFLMQRFAYDVDQLGGWMTAKELITDYNENFAEERHEYLKFVLHSLLKYPKGLRDGKNCWAVHKCVRHAHVDTPMCETDY